MSEPLEPGELERPSASGLGLPGSSELGPLGQSEPLKPSELERPTTAGVGLPTRIRAPRRLTSLTLSVGVLVAAACFIIAGVAELAGVATGSGDMTDVAAIVEGLAAFTPWAWATLGTLAVIVTPAVGLIVTAYEYASISDRRSMALALTVLLILGGSTVVAFLR